MMKFQYSSSSGLCLLLSTLAIVFVSTRAAVSCATGDYNPALGADRHCQYEVHINSRCNSNSICSNPYRSGCLQAKLGDDNSNNFATSIKRRVCNSDDSLSDRNDVKDSICDISPFNYTEIRIHNGNWESSIFYAWAMQILLSEILQVPVTIGRGGIDEDYTTTLNSFYDDNNYLKYSSTAYDYQAIEEANKHNGDCTQTSQECFHVMPEVWNGQITEYTKAMSNGVIDPVEGDGQVGKISWYIPKYTAKRHKTLVSYYGLSSSDSDSMSDSFISDEPTTTTTTTITVTDNRELLASTFKRPMTWKQYCDEISLDKCETPDKYATHYPSLDSSQGGSYFVGQDAYIGYFHATDENNCTLYPTTCTGHIVAPPCGWSSFIDSQLYWNDIALKSNGNSEPNGSYTYSEMIQIWNAANATKSDVMMWWFTPDATVELFRDTEYEFQPVLLPEPTASCRDNRISAEARCSLDIWERRGLQQGSCDSEAHSLQKVIASSLRKADLQVPIAERSPGYTTVRNFKISDLDMDNILKAWIRRDKDTYGFDAREAVCDWVASNIDQLENFIPLGYPREISDDSEYDGAPFVITVQILAVIGVFFVLVTGAMVYQYRNTRVFVFAQVKFVLLLIGGLLVIATAAVLHGIMPTDSICVSREWLITVGYTAELVPLVVKLSAINRIVQSAKKNKRIKISLRQMFMTVAALILGALVYLTIWTVLDPVREIEKRVLVEEDANLVQSSLSCTSNATFWKLITTGWVGLLLVMATVLAFQTRNIVVAQEFNESQSLGTMIYSHFMFMILRVIVGIMENNNIFTPYWSSGATSIILSLDVMFATCIYIVPKIVTAKLNPDTSGRNDYTMSIAVSGRADGGGGSSSKSKNKSSIQLKNGKQENKRRGSKGSFQSIEGPTKSILNDLSMFSVSDDDSHDDGGGGDQLIDMMNCVSERLSNYSVGSGLSDNVNMDNTDEEEDGGMNQEEEEEEAKTVDETNSSGDGSRRGSRGSLSAARSKMREIEQELHAFKRSNSQDS